MYSVVSFFVFAPVKASLFLTRKSKVILARNRVVAICMPGGNTCALQIVCGCWSEKSDCKPSLNRHLSLSVAPCLHSLLLPIPYPTRYKPSPFSDLGKLKSDCDMSSVLTCEGNCLLASSGCIMCRKPGNIPTYLSVWVNSNHTHVQSARVKCGAVLYACGTNSCTDPPAGYLLE